MEGPRYESRLGLEMPLIEEVKQLADDLERIAEEAANQFSAHASNPQFRYVEHLPPERRRKYLAHPLLAEHVNGTHFSVSGIIAVNYLTQAEISKNFEDWKREHVEHATALEGLITGRVPFLNSEYLLSSIALCSTYEHAMGVDLKREKTILKEILYYAVLIAHLDTKKQKPLRLPWLVRNGSKERLQRLQIENGQINFRLEEIYERLARREVD